MFRHPFELKLEIVNFVIEGKHSYKQASQKYHIHQEQIRVWCNLYRNSGEDGLKPQKIKKYDGNFKVDVVEYMYANHLSFEKTRMHFKLPSSTIIVLWKQMYDEKGREYLLNNRSMAINHMQVERNKRMRKSTIWCHMPITSAFNSLNENAQYISEAKLDYTVSYRLAWAKGIQFAANK